MKLRRTLYDFITMFTNDRQQGFCWARWRVTLPTPSLILDSDVFTGSQVTVGSQLSRARSLQPGPVENCSSPV